jgi:hypothetical protein
MRKLSCFVVAVCLTAGTAICLADDAEEGGHTTKEVMQQAHKGGLLKKVLDGNASDEEKVQLLNLYVSLRENEAPKGDGDSWNDKTDAILIAAAKVVAGRDGATDELKGATNCMACHSVHKP